MTPFLKKFCYPFMGPYTAPAKKQKSPPRSRRPAHQEALADAQEEQPAGTPPTQDAPVDAQAEPARRVEFSQDAPIDARSQPRGTPSRKKTKKTPLLKKFFYAWTGPHTEMKPEKQKQTRNRKRGSREQPAEAASGRDGDVNDDVSEDDDISGDERSNSAQSDLSNQQQQQESAHSSNSSSSESIEPPASAKSGICQHTALGKVSISPWEVVPDSNASSSDFPPLTASGSYQRPIPGNVITSPQLTKFYRKYGLLGPDEDT